MADKKFDTDAIRVQMEKTDYREHTSPLFLSSSFVFNSADQGRRLFSHEEAGNMYSRFSNPNTTEFEQKIAKAENAQAALSTGSGMAAVFSSLAALADQGDHIIAARALFGSTHQILTGILPRWGIEHSYVDITDSADWNEQIQENTRILFLETPSNPGLDLIDLEWAAELADKHDLIMIVDNCFATPYLQQPLNLGAGLVVHSATKYIDGQGRVMGGAVAGKARYIDEIRFFVNHTGPTLSPFNAWMLSKSMETLSVRMKKHCDSAEALARFLDSEKQISRVKYPFLESHPQHELARKQMKRGGGIVVFEISEEYDKAIKFMDSLEMVSLSANLGDSRTIATHPASTTHSDLTEKEQRAVGITPGLIRISVGLENSEDIIEDIRQALKSVVE